MSRNCFEINTLSLSGISNTERQKRKESNKLSTTLNFISWLMEVITAVFGFTFSLQRGALLVAFIPLPVSQPARFLTYMILNHTSPPLFYIVALEKDTIRKWKVFKVIFRSNNTVHPLPMVVLVQPCQSPPPSENVQP